MARFTGADSRGSDEVLTATAAAVARVPARPPRPRGPVPTGVTRAGPGDGAHTGERHQPQGTQRLVAAKTPAPCARHGGRSLQAVGDGRAPWPGLPARHGRARVTPGGSRGTDRVPGALSSPVVGVTCGAGLSFLVGGPDDRGGVGLCGSRMGPRPRRGARSGSSTGPRAPAAPARSSQARRGPGPRSLRSAPRLTLTRPPAGRPPPLNFHCQVGRSL